jgi:DNA-binding transcriptional MocR family regulator
MSATSDVSSASFEIVGASARDIAASVERGIQQEHIAPGDPLPSVRELARRLQVSAATVGAAYRTLRDRGLVTTYERSRTRVASRPPLAIRPEAEIPEGVEDLSSGNPDPQLLPSLEQAISQIEFPVRLYGARSSLPELVEELKAELEEAGPPVEHAIVVSGGLDGIERVLQAHLRPADRVAVEDPCYMGLLDLVRAMGLECYPVAVDARGPLPDAAARAMEDGAAAMVITPRAQNPTGAAIDDARAAELRSVLAGFPDRLIIESDHVGVISGVPRFSTISNQVHWALVRSINKSHGPDLRVGVVAADATTVSRVEGRQSVGCGWVSHILQRTALQLLRDGTTSALVRRAARLYTQRREALTEALAAHGIPATARAGFNVWIPVPEEHAVISALRQRGWAVRAGEPYRLQSGPAIRVTTSTLDPGEASRFADDLTAVLSPGRPARSG